VSIIGSVPNSRTQRGEELEGLELLARVEPKQFREAMSLFATGVTVITTNPPSGPAGMTASAVCSLSVEPVQLLVCISQHLPTHHALMECGRFAVNVLGEGQGALARRFATPSIDKFAGVECDEYDGIQVLRPAIAHFVCDLKERFPGGDHSIFIGQVTRLGLRPGSRPLLYFASEFGSVATPEDALLKAWLSRGAAV
jgi:3-hydroxy-9,10-secoandrosta-1,3,5(10)-triene-9,17-dione monooxygenase reductase component